ncbi:MAG: hypothetical protein COA52_19740 [Hyphomicrobiales bacterium]|nr:MAG: hypothetical protein COA52_19740 [Hyphomicrobiales bacterium]
MSKSYWRSAKIRSIGLAGLICLALFMLPQAVLFAGSGSYMGFSYALIILVVIAPLFFLAITLLKISLLRRLDRSHDIDEEDRLQRRAHPKIMRAFPVDGTENNEFHWPLGVNPNFNDSSSSDDQNDPKNPNKSPERVEGQKQ